jgi:predicted TIM-barrel fold metal-dependent hydrolase
VTLSSAPPFDGPVVDTHAHIYTLDMPLSGTAWHKPPQDARIDQYLAVLDQHGVSFGVLAAASTYGDYNDYLLLATRTHKRLRTTVIVRPDIELSALQRMKDDGAVGIRLQWRHVANPPDLDSPEYRRLLRRVADLGWHVQLHDDGARLAKPLAVLQQAGVTIVVDHFGRPDTALGLQCPGFQAVLRSVELGRTWVKLSSAFRLESPAASSLYAGALLQHAGPERLFWGSDWPFAAFETSIDFQQTLDSFRQWVPDPAARRMIGTDNPLRFYFFGTP